MNFEEYLRQESEKGAIDFRIRYTVGNQGIGFYIHPINRDGATADYRVDGNTLTYIPPIPPLPPGQQGLGEQAA